MHERAIYFVEKAVFWDFATEENGRMQMWYFQNALEV